MKKIVTLLCLSCMAVGMVWAAEQPLVRLTPVQLAQMRLNGSSEGDVRDSRSDCLKGNEEKRLDTRGASATATGALPGRGIHPVAVFPAHAWKQVEPDMKRLAAPRSVSAASTWLDEGNYDISWVNTANLEVTLTTPEQLAGLAYLVSTYNGYSGLTVRLGADIDLSAHEWVPFGTAAHPFSGVFDGRGHTISGLRVNNREYAGFIGYAAGAEVRNVMFASDCRIDGNMAGTVAGCFSDGVVENCYSEAEVLGYYAGGFVGEGETSTFRLDVFNGSVSKKPDPAEFGIFAGDVLSSFDTEETDAVRISIERVSENSDEVAVSLVASQTVIYQFSGTVAQDETIHVDMGQSLGVLDPYSLYLYGGDGNSILAEGQFSMTISADRKTLTVSATQGNVLYVVGTIDFSEIFALERLVLPFSLQRVEPGQVGTLSSNGGQGWDNCYYRDDSAPEAVQRDGVALTAGQMQSASLVETLNEGVGETALTQPRNSLFLWTAGTTGPALSSEICPALSWWDEGNYDISWYDAEQSEFVLTTPAQLAGLSWLVGHTSSFSNAVVKLGADIDLSGYRWVPVGDNSGNKSASFSGAFDGCGHTISGLQVNDEACAGLFGYVNKGDIRNLMLSSSCEVSGAIAGSIVASMGSGSIVNCRSDATVQGLTAGGLVGDCRNATLLSSIFNGQVIESASASEWEGLYQAVVSSPFSGEEDLEVPLEVKILADKAIPDEYTLTITSSRSDMSYTMVGYLEDDGKLHIALKQKIGIYGNTYSLLLDDGTLGSGEILVTYSPDQQSITFSTANNLMLVVAYTANNENVGYLDGWRLPFTASSSEQSLSQLGGVAGSLNKALVENCYYRAGCLPDGVADTEQALPSDELLSQAQVTAMNEAAMAVLSDDPYVKSLNRWQLGDNGPVLSQETEAYTGWWTSEGNYDISWYDEAQTEFSLSTPAQLAGLASLVNQGLQFTGKTVTLNNDIDLSGHRWVPVGSNVYYQFMGTFDGGGHTIHNLEIDMKGYSYSYVTRSGSVGLFGMSSGSIRNVVLGDDCSVKYTATGGNFAYVGAICGVLGGSYMDNCHNRASVESRSQYTDVYTAGVIGFNNTYRPLYNSSNRGSVMAESESGEVLAAGLEGTNARIVNCYNAGDVSARGHRVSVSGICASFSYQQNVYHTGTLSATGVALPDGTQPQVFVSPFSATSFSSVEMGYYDVTCVADTTGMNLAGVAMQPDAMKQADFAELLTANATAMMELDPELLVLLAWENKAGENNGYPVFGDAIEVGGWWTSEGNYDISWYDEAQTEFSLSTPAQLGGLAYLVKHGTTFEGKTVTLTADIDLDGLKWESIGSTTEAFSGTFDGGNHEIHNLHSEVLSSNTAVAGLFGQIVKARIAHVVLADDCVVKSSTYSGGITAYASESEIVSCINRASVALESPYGYVGGIAGYVSGSFIDRCENWGFVEATVVITGNYSSYLASGAGIAGFLSNTVVLNCANHADVIVEGSTQNYSFVGGIMGYCDEKSGAMNCYNTGLVMVDKMGYAGGISGAAVTYLPLGNCYNTGEVLTSVGGAYPIAPSGTPVTNCFYRSDCVEAGDYQGVSMSADEMKSPSLAALLNLWSKSNNSSNPDRESLYWKVEAGLNDGYPVFTEQDPGYTSVETPESGLRIYPTVVTNELYVSGAALPIYVYSMTGCIVSVATPAEGLTVIDLSQLPQGVYLVRIGKHVERVIKR